MLLVVTCHCYQSIETLNVPLTLALIFEESHLLICTSLSDSALSFVLGLRCVCVGGLQANSSDEAKKTTTCARDSCAPYWGGRDVSSWILSNRGTLPLTLLFSRSDDRIGFSVTDSWDVLILRWNKFHMIACDWPIGHNLKCAWPFNRWKLSSSITIRIHWAWLVCPMKSMKFFWLRKCPFLRSIMNISIAGFNTYVFFNIV